MSGPALWASGVSESRHQGWCGGLYYLDACGRLGRRDERVQVALQCIPRSLVSAPAVHPRRVRVETTRRKVERGATIA
jgi:hypothetical protein